MSNLDIIRDFILSNPGHTSSEICDIHPHILRATVTSVISKLKRRGDVSIDSLGKLSGVGVPAPRIYKKNASQAPESSSASGTYKFVAKCSPSPAPEPISELRPTLDKDRTLNILKPFAEYATFLRSKGLGSGHPYVLMAGTTDVPHVVTADGNWFLDAEAYYNDLLNS